MEQVISYVWCDVCLAKGVRIAAEPANVSIGESVLLETDLCEKHRRALAREVRKVLPRKRKRRATKRDTEGPFRCVVAGGCGAPPLANRRTLWQHIRGFHDLTMSEYVENYGDPVPMTKEELRDLVVEAHCDVTGCGQVYSTATGTRWPHQALVSHMRGRHAIKLTRDGQKIPI